MLVTKDMVFADRDKRRKGRQVKVVHVEDGYATVEVVTDSESAVKSSLGKSTDIRVSRLTKEYDYVGQRGKSTYVGPEDLRDAKIVSFPRREMNVSGAGILFMPSADFEPTTSDYDLEAELIAALSEPISADLDSNGRFGITLQVPVSDDEDEDDLIEDENDLEDALRTAGYHWLAPADDLVELVEKYMGEEVDHGDYIEIAVRVTHQIIKERLVG